MDEDIELTVRYASASLDGETARIAVVTDSGPLTLQMHRIVLGALAGSIARALFPRTSEPAPLLGDEPAAPVGEVSIAPLGDVEPHDDLAQDDVGRVDVTNVHPPETEGAAGVDYIPTQPEAHEPDQGPAFAGPKPDDDRSQPEPHAASSKGPGSSRRRKRR
jgi:hypothetical protein